MTVWTDERCKQLDALWELVRTVRGIDDGNAWIEKIQRCIRLAGDVQDTQWGAKPFVPSFMAFLHDLAIADRKAADGRDA